ncbi:uncharacterized protein BT62DRAFT_1012444 [Guyanagaster necrorhizus]|uniref:Uncharacterized protein n=1 Tax=Guyanagaster necrorhizus TaxID=856835 RepID=A0A9P7VGP3_9AGAR|nr:uncharacterized protein BT62DRAFT_1012444 [Guyanagaster necrorhizus MCA 3950]KAG7440668.1 hypothetical protein BT62DRAFT_1012444 [Guyanagaster necrorhizus MCA 3950]
MFDDDSFSLNSHNMATGDECIASHFLANDGFASLFDTGFDFGRILMSMDDDDVGGSSIGTNLLFLPIDNMGFDVLADDNYCAHPESTPHSSTISPNDTVLSLHAPPPEVSVTVMMASVPPSMWQDDAQHSPDPRDMYVSARHLELSVVHENVMGNLYQNRLRLVVGAREKQRTSENSNVRISVSKKWRDNMISY